MPRARLIRIALASVLALLVAAALVLWQGAGRQPPPELVVATSNIGGPFALTAHTGERVTEESWPGQLLLVYFGYTFCPDICPTDLGEIARAMDLLGEDGTKVQPLFVSIDPERDTAARLAEFMPLFHPRLVGLTGTPEEIAAAARNYRLYYEKASGGDAENYLMNHTAFIYLQGPDGRNLAVFPQGTPAEDLAAAIRRTLAAPQA